VTRRKPSPLTHEAHDGALTKVKQKLGEDDFVAAWADGARLTADEAIA